MNAVPMASTIDFETHQKLRGALAKVFLTSSVSPEEEWFTGEIMEDSEFPSGRYNPHPDAAGSSLRNFTRKDGRGCMDPRPGASTMGLDYHLL